MIFTTSLLASSPEHEQAVLVALPPLAWDGLREDAHGKAR